MNERIQELIKQAMVLDDDELFVREVFDREKFAELIVRECVTAIEEMHRYARSTDAKRVEEATIQDCIRAVREQFGVDVNS